MVYKMNEKRIIVAVILFYIGVIVFGWALEKYTLYKTAGQCNFMFMCTCDDLGPGICDGAHEHIRIGR